MGRFSEKLHKLFITFLVAVLAMQAFAAESDFPIPENLRPAIKFWVRVYTEIDTSTGFLHDSRDLNIVYQSLERDRRTINSTRKQISDDLKLLASGRRSNLSVEQSKILALWPADVSNARLAQAAENVRWQLGQSDRFVAGLKRSGAYREHIEAVVLEKGLPIELAALPHVESSFHPGAYSSAAATGMWQFVRSTADRFMQVDYVVDERLDPYEATYGAMELLEFNYNALGTWPLALTAYNHGANGMARAVRDVGSDDIGRIIEEYKGPRFGFASRNFYPQFLAVQEVESRIEEFFGVVDMDPSPVFVKHELEAYIDATVLAQSLNISLSVLKKDNPSLQPSVWTGTKLIPSGYQIKVNRDAFSGDLVASLDLISSDYLFAQQIPDLSYTISRGDSLSVIAERFDTSISELVAINQLRNRNRIKVGQILLLPQADGSVPTLLVNANIPREIPQNGKYDVERGDTVSAIADRFRLTEEAILAMNGLNPRSIIYPGQKLNLKPQNIEPSYEQTQQEEEVPVQSELLATVIPSAGGSTVISDAIDSAQPEAVIDVAAVDPRELPGEPVLAQLSLDSNNLALPVDERMQEVERQEQLVADLSIDPTDYLVDSDNRVEIQAIETLGHYADWLNIRAQDIRALNGMSFSEPLLIGKRLELDFTKVDIATFERKRREFHRNFQTQYFADWRIQNTEEYRIKSRDYLENLTQERSVPMWLFRQYNPGIDSSHLQIGQVIVFPVVQRVQL